MLKFFGGLTLFIGMILFAEGLMLHTMNDGVLNREAVGVTFLFVGVLMFVHAYFIVLDCVKWVAGVPKPRTWPKRFLIFWTCTLFGRHLTESEFIYADPVMPSHDTLLGWRERCTRCGAITKQKEY